MKYALVLAVLAACGSSPPPAKTPPPPPPPADAAPSATPVVAECQDYIGAMKRLAACPKVPAEAQDALQKSATEFERDVVNFTTSDEARSTCTQGLDGIRQSIIQLGC